MIQIICVDLSDISNTDDLFTLFSQAFGFPAYFGNNWDAFEEILLDVDIKKKHLENMTGIHLICTGYDGFKAHFPISERNIFESILTDLSIYSKQSPHGFVFTFEMQ